MNAPLKLIELPRMANEQEPTDDQFQNTLSLLAWQIQKRVKDGESPIRYALAFSLLRAASHALDGDYSGRETKILKSISVKEDGGEIVSIFPFDKLEEAERLVEVVKLELNLIPYADPNGDLLETEQHKRGVADIVLGAIQRRFRVSTYWRTLLPADWDSQENKENALQAIVDTLAKMQHVAWSANAGKVIRAYLRAVGTDPNRFKNIDF